MRRPLVALRLLAALIALIATPAARAAGLSDWAVVIVAGDDRAAHSDEHSEAFDNARRDVAAALTRAGFAAFNIAQFSVQPEADPQHAPLRSDPPVIGRALDALAEQARGGCLVYFSSHGAPQGVLVGDALLTPRGMARLVDEGCGARPTVVVLSACFSGALLPALAAPNRLIMTAARRDRASFGCGESDRYPYFDGCVLEELPASADFLILADRVKRCVRRREIETGSAPPSEPQTFVGQAFRAASPSLAAAAGR